MKRANAGMLWPKWTITNAPITASDQPTRIAQCPIRSQRASPRNPTRHSTRDDTGLDVPAVLAIGGIATAVAWRPTSATLAASDNFAACLAMSQKDHRRIKARRWQY
jgi:hypothetical protein